eukprot:g27778.t1
MGPEAVQDVRRPQMWQSLTGASLAALSAASAELRAKCQRLADLISNARHLIAFTGAGISTGAGIADFRSGINTSLPTGPGLWERPKSASPSNLLEQCAQAEPGPTHRVLQRLWKGGLLKHIISQNVDGAQNVAMTLSARSTPFALAATLAAAVNSVEAPYATVASASGTICHNRALACFAWPST